MKRRVNLGDALEAWMEMQTAERGELADHIAPELLYSVLIEPRHEQREDVLDHVIRCSPCLREFKDMAASIEEAAAWDVALPKAAGSELAWPKKIPTNDGKYLIEIRRSLSKEDSGVITLRVEEPFRSAIEGKTVRVFDGTRRVLLRGQIVDGEVSQPIDALSTIVSEFVVLTD